MPTGSATNASTPKITSAPYFTAAQWAVIDAAALAALNGIVGQSGRSTTGLQDSTISAAFIAHLGSTITAAQKAALLPLYPPNWQSQPGFWQEGSSATPFYNAWDGALHTAFGPKLVYTAIAGMATPYTTPSTTAAPGVGSTPAITLVLTSVSCPLSTAGKSSYNVTCTNAGGTVVGSWTGITTAQTLSYSSASAAAGVYTWTIWATCTNNSVVTASFACTAAIGTTWTNVVILGPPPTVAVSRPPGPPANLTLAIPQPPGTQLLATWTQSMTGTAPIAGYLLLWGAIGGPYPNTVDCGLVYSYLFPVGAFPFSGETYEFVVQAYDNGTAP